MTENKTADVNMTATDVQVEIEAEPTPEQQNSAINNAADEVKLAIDLIYLLETHHIDRQTALKALKIVENDIKKHF